MAVYQDVSQALLVLVRSVAQANQSQPRQWSWEIVLFVWWSWKTHIHIATTVDFCKCTAHSDFNRPNTQVHQVRQRYNVGLDEGCSNIMKIQNWVSCSIPDASFAIFVKCCMLNPSLPLGALECHQSNHLPLATKISEQRCVWWAEKWRGVQSIQLTLPSAYSGPERASVFYLLLRSHCDAERAFWGEWMISPSPHETTWM